MDSTAHCFACGCIVIILIGENLQAAMLGYTLPSGHNEGGQNSIITTDDTPTVMLAAPNGSASIPLGLKNHGACAA